MKMAGLKIIASLCFLLLLTPGRKGWGSVIIHPGDRNEDTTTAHCVFLPKAAGGPHAVRPLFRSKPPNWSSFQTKGAVHAGRPLVLNANHGLHRLHGD
jgi:hypothetical protein